jgi:hypothetical protein
MVSNPCEQVNWNSNYYRFEQRQVATKRHVRRRNDAGDQVRLRARLCAHSLSSLMAMYSLAPRLSTSSNLLFRLLMSTTLSAPVLQRTGLRDVPGPLLPRCRLSCQDHSRCLSLDDKL